MLTQCPNCDTSFRVTSEILRVAQGQVRCGRCETQFDALERLVEEDFTEDSDSEDATLQTEAIDMQLSEPELEDTPATEEDAPEDAEEWLEIEDLEAQTTAASVTDADDLEDGDTAQSIQDEESDDELAGVYEQADDEDVPPSDAEEYATEEEEFEADDAPISVAAPIRSRASYAPPQRERARALPQMVIGRPAPAPQLADDEFGLTERPLRTPSERLWKYVAAPLTLLLVFQIFNHYRAPLARHPRFGNAVTSFYRALGIEVIPDWNLRAYETKRSSVVVDLNRPGTLRARVTVRNRAAFPQPYPLLKLVLYDRFGGAVRAREFTPLEYLDKPVVPNARMAPLQEVNASFSIIDPGKEDASGNLFYVCLRGKNGTVCTDDLPMISN